MWACVSVRSALIYSTWACRAKKSKVCMSCDETQSVKQPCTTAPTCPTLLSNYLRNTHSVCKCIPDVGLLDFSYSREEEERQISSHPLSIHLFINLRVLPLPQTLPPPHGCFTAHPQRRTAFETEAKLL